LVLLVAGCASAWLGAASGVHELDAQYRFSCSSCHGLDGLAKGPGGIRLPGRVLADRKWFAQQKEAALLTVILEGKGAMPGFKYKLSPEEAEGMLSEVIRPMARKAR
jgi:mono/diheme cytochrome c family protein